MHTLLNTEPDGNCMFRAFSMILTGTQRQHNIVRSQIDAYLKAHANLFLRNPGCFDSAVYKTMEITSLPVIGIMLAGAVKRSSTLWP